MNAVRHLRRNLEWSQKRLGRHIGKAQMTISLYEAGQTVPPDVAKRLILLAKSQGQELSFEHLYAPEWLPNAEPAENAETKPDGPSA